MLRPPESLFTNSWKNLDECDVSISRLCAYRPLAPPEYRRGGMRPILFIPPLYSGGLGGVRGPPRSFPRIVKTDLASLGA